MNPAFSITTDGRTFDPDAPKYAQPSPAEKQALASFRQVLRSDPIGFQTDNRQKQAQHLKGIIYVAISRIRNLASGSSYEVYQRKRKRSARSVFGGNGSFAKSVASPQAQGRDEEYTPFDDEDHPLVRMLKRPNPNETFGELSAKLVLQNRLTGVGPLWAVPNEKHKPVELWSLKTPLLYPIYQHSTQYPNGAWRIVPYMMSGWGRLPAGLSSAGATIPGEEVKRFMEPHPFIDWDGYSPLTAGDKQLDVLESIDEARKTAMDRGVVLDTYMVVPGADQPTLDRITAEMQAARAGSKNHRAFAAFGTASPDSKATIQSVNARVVDMDFPEGWEQMTAFCLALFGVPKSVANLQTAGSYSEHYAARQQFHDDQADFLESLATFYTKALAWPWESFPGEYIIRAIPRPINDKEMKEKQHSRQDQNGTITLNESRAMDDLDPWPDPEVGALPVPVALAVIQQQAAPQPEPGAAGTPPGPGQEPGQDQPQDAQGLQDAITSEALATLGVPEDNATSEASGALNGQAVGKAIPGVRGPWDEAKHARNRGKFAPKGGGVGASTPASPQQPDPRWGAGYASRLGQQGRQGPPPLPGQRTASKPPPLPPPKTKQEHQQRVRKSAPKVAQMAGNIPEGADVLASASRWAVAAADKHADAVSAHLGITRQQAHNLIRSTIEQLCNAASTINRTGAAQKTYRGASGKKLKFQVKRDMPRGGKRGGPTAGAVPRPANPSGQGSRPPLPAAAKSMGELAGSMGGFLVPDGYVKPAKKKRRKLRSIIRKALAELEE